MDTVEARVESFLAMELIVGARFDDPPLFKNEDSICHLDRGESVGNQYCRAIPSEMPKPAEDLELRLNVKIRCRLIENKNGCFLGQRPSNGNLLPLTF